MAFQGCFLYISRVRIVKVPASVTCQYIFIVNNLLNVVCWPKSVFLNMGAFTYDFSSRGGEGVSKCLRLLTRGGGGGGGGEGGV